MGKYDWNYGDTSGVKQLNPGADPHTGWLDMQGHQTSEPGHGILDKIGEIAPYAIMGTMGAGMLSDVGAFSSLGHLGGSMAGKGSAASMFGGPNTTLEQIASGIGSGGGGAAHGGLSAALGGFLKGIDPTEALLGGLSLFGGPKGPQQMKPFTGFETNPEDVYTRLNSSISRLGQGLTERKPVQLRQPGPAPVQIQGLPFQIGGGLGTDPAGPNDVLDLSSIFGYDPFQSMPQQEKARGSQR